MSAGRIAFALVCAVLALPVPAQSLRDSAQVDAGAGAGSSGRIAVNQAAGNGNTQANLAAVAFAEGGNTLVVVDALQQAQSSQARGATRSARADVAAGAFAGTTGAFALNQAAGAANQQTNLLAIGQGGMQLHAVQIASADDAALAETGSAGTGTEGTALAQLDRHASIDTDAFRGSQGVMQINQTAGVGNLSTNAIVLQLPGGTP